MSLSDVSSRAGKESTITAIIFMLAAAICTACLVASEIAGRRDHSTDGFTMIIDRNNSVLRVQVLITLVMAPLGGVSLLTKRAWGLIVSGLALLWILVQYVVGPIRVRGLGAMSGLESNQPLSIDAIWWDFGMLAVALALLVWVLKQLVMRATPAVRRP